MHRFTYAPLNVALQEIRLIKLLAGVFDDALEAEIFHTPLSVSHRPDYEALSYVWGSTDNPKAIAVRQSLQLRDSEAPWYKKLWPPRAGSVEGGIRVNHKRKGSIIFQFLSITQNLFIALQHLRLPGVDRVLWIDAICINQEDIPERSAEVGRMGNIYSSASQSIVWLGPECENSDLAIDTLRWIGQDLISDVAMKVSTAQRGSKTEMLQRDQKAIEAKNLEWVAIRDLLNRKWFTRLWIHQEIKLSKRAMVVAGFSQLSWDAFRWSIYWVKGYVADSTASVSGIFDDDYFSEYIKPVIAPLRGDGQILSLVRNIRHTNCSDPKDRVYGILSMLPPELKLGIIPNYYKTQEEVYQEFVRHYIISTGLLNIFAFCEIHDSFPRLPTWVPDLSVAKTTFEISRGYAASTLSCANGAFSQDGKQICFAGVYAGTIQQIENPVLHTTLLPDIVNLCRSWIPSNAFTESYIGGGTVVDAYALTFVCGDVKEHLPPYAGDVSMLEEVRSVLLSRIRDGIADSTMKKVATRMLWFLRGRAFGTTSKGYMGAFPAAAQIGDQICVALGCKVPLLLRPVIGHQNHYQLVGECYVPGLMDGEALLGRLPEDWRLGEINSDQNRVYVNKKASLGDPRLGPLPCGWHIVYKAGKERDEDGNLNRFWFENGDTGEGGWADPRLTKEALIERGVEMRDFTVI